MTKPLANVPSIVWLLFVKLARMDGSQQVCVRRPLQNSYREAVSLCPLTPVQTWQQISPKMTIPAPVYRSLHPVVWLHPTSGPPEFFFHAAPACRPRIEMQSDWHSIHRWISVRA